MEKQTEEIVTRSVALGLAVIHHGLANFASKAVPSGWSTAISTAEKFHAYMLGNSDK